MLCELYSNAYVLACENNMIYTTAQNAVKYLIRFVGSLDNLTGFCVIVTGDDDISETSFLN